MPKELDLHHRQIKERVESLLKNMKETERKLEEMRLLCNHPQRGCNVCLVCGQEMDIGSPHPDEDEDDPEVTCGSFAE